MNTNMENTSEPQLSSVIAEGLLKLKKDPTKETKEGVDLLEIAKKLSSKKFGKKK